MLAPDAGATVYRLLRVKTVESPTLLIPESGGYAVVSGTYAVNQALEPVTSTIAPVFLAKRALLVMTGLILLTLIFQAEISPLLCFLPLAGLVAVGALWGNCWHCNTGTSTLSKLAPLLGLVYLAAGMMLFTIPIIQRRSAFLCFLAVSALIPVAQAYMLTSEPKLCPACLTFTFVSACYFAGTLRVLRAERLIGFAAPRWAQAAVVIGLIGLLVRHSLVLAGYVTLGNPMEQTIPSIIGSPLSEYISLPYAFRPGTLLVVSLPGCHACEQAAQDLPGMGVAWKTVPVCSMATTQGCFSSTSKGLNFPTPMLLIYGSDGRILYQHDGWFGSPQERQEFAAQIQNLQRRTRDQNGNASVWVPRLVSHPASDVHTKAIR